MNKTRICSQLSRNQTQGKSKRKKTKRIGQGKHGQVEKTGEGELQDEREAGSSAGPSWARNLLQRMCSATGHLYRFPVMFLASVLRRKTRAGGCEIPSCSVGDPGSRCRREWAFMEQSEKQQGLWPT